MIDCEHEKIIPLRAVRDLVPSRLAGKSVSPTTIWRWATKKQNPLDTIQIGGGRFTSVQAVARFIESCNIRKAGALPDLGARAERAGKALRKLLGGDHVPPL